MIRGQAAIFRPPQQFAASKLAPTAFGPVQLQVALAIARSGCKPMLMKRLFHFIVVCAFVLTGPLAFSRNPIAGLDLLTGSDRRIDSEGKQGMVVVFLSAKCPCSNSHTSEISDLAKKYSQFSFVAVHSNADESLELSQAYFRSVGFPFPVIRDDGFKIADELKALKTPHTFLFDAKDQLVYHGGVSNSKDCAKADRKYLREALEDLAASRPVRTPEGRTLGCAISRGEKHVW